MEKTSPGVAYIESIANSGLMIGIEHWSMPGLVRLFPIFFTLRESHRAPDPALIRAYSSSIRLHSWRLGSEAFRLLQHWGDIVTMKEYLHHKLEFSPVFFIAHGHPTHKAKKVLTFIDSTNGKLRQYILALYSPEPNPDEFVRNRVKNQRIGPKRIAGPDNLRRKIESYLLSLKKMPRKIKGFFREKHVRYILHDMSGA